MKPPNQKELQALATSCGAKGIVVIVVNNKAGTYSIKVNAFGDGDCKEIAEFLKNECKEKANSLYQEKNWNDD